MNLLKKLQDEVKGLGLTDEYEIAYLIYIRIGELFDYDEMYPYSEDSRILFYEENPENVKNNKLICFSWAHLYKDLLCSFGIEARVIENSVHAYVTFEANGETYSADLMKDYEDVSRIKFGFPVTHFIGKKKRDNSLLDKKIHYFKFMNVEEALSLFEMEINNGEENRDERLLKIFKFAEYYFNFDRVNVRFISAKRFIRLIFSYLQRFDYDKADFVDERLGDFVRIYTLHIKNTLVYFILKKDEEGLYRLREASKKEVKDILENYDLDFANNFVFLDEQGKIHKIW